jgi:hypothetical protein
MVAGLLGNSQVIRASSRRNCVRADVRFLVREAVRTRCFHAKCGCFKGLWEEEQNAVVTFEGWARYSGFASSAYRIDAAGWLFP